MISSIDNRLSDIDFCVFQAKHAGQAIMWVVWPGLPPLFREDESAVEDEADVVDQVEVTSHPERRGQFVLIDSCQTLALQRTAVASIGHASTTRGQGRLNRSAGRRPKVRAAANAIANDMARTQPLGWKVTPGATIPRSTGEILAMAIRAKGTCWFVQNRGLISLKFPCFALITPSDVGRTPPML